MVPSFDSLECTVSHNTAFRQGKHVKKPWYTQARDVLSRLDYLHSTILLTTPVIAVWAMFNIALQRNTLILAIVWYWIGGLGVTAGYHRFYAHKAFSVNKIAEILLICMGTSAIQGSIKWWAGGHRVHHRYTDTKYDPYNSKSDYGLWYSHFGWMLVHPKPENRKYADIHDLNENHLVYLQHKYYLFLAPVFAFLLPTLIAGLMWGDYSGGYFFAGVARLVFLHHSTFCVNSIAHYLGEANFDDERTPRDSLITALLTFGEGFHNFHHLFPQDYRNGIHFWDYDPTKWLINFFYRLGWATGLKMSPPNEIWKAQASMKHKQWLEIEQKISKPKSFAELPEITFAEMQRLIQSENLQLTVINNVVYNLSAFIGSHPGGQIYIKSVVGIHATKDFYGLTGVYKHSPAAHYVLENMRYAKLAASDQVEEINKVSIKQHEEKIPKLRKSCYKSVK